MLTEMCSCVVYSVRIISNVNSLYQVIYSLRKIQSCALQSIVYNEYGWDKRRTAILGACFYNKHVVAVVHSLTTRRI